MKPFAMVLASASCLAAWSATVVEAQSIPADATVRPVSAIERTKVVTELADVLKREYVDALVGKRYAKRLRTQLALGAYDRLTDPVALGDAITADLQTVSPDRHLRVGPRDGFRKPRPLLRDMPESAKPSGPPGLEAAAVLPGNIAYLRFNAFPDDPTSAQKARSFLLSHQDARAIVIDCRPNRGGGMEVMNAILPLFYDKPTVQVRMDTRTSAEAGSPDEPEPMLVRRRSAADIIRYDHLVTPDATERGLRRTPIYYLTSRRTASAAEHFALALHRNRRAVLVGETTAGANHYGDEVAVGERFLAFVPVGRTYDPDTGKDWEGSGIKPDVQVPADDALDVALRLARKHNGQTRTGNAG
jgi:Peptidase family S41/N-terminal domain of Peptidase_S41 in eukaryotic IRBP